MPSRDEINYASVLLTGQQKTFIKTLLGLYKKRAKRRWILQSDTQQANVIFIGEQRGGSDASNFKVDVTSDQMIILFDKNKTLKHPYVYRADFRQFSGNIIEAIERCESDFVMLRRLVTMEDFKSKSCYVKLIKWPAIAFIQKNTGYAMMATLLMGKKMEFSRFVQISGHDEAFCLNFINKAYRLGYVEVSKCTSLQSNKIMQQGEQAQGKLGLFSRIRNRLGLEKTKRHP